MKGRLSIFLPTLALFLATSPLHANTITWRNASSGNWSDTSNWNPKHVPGAGDTAVITVSGNYTVTLDASASVGGLVLGATDGTTQTFSINGQTFTLAGQATVNAGGLIDLSSGTFNGNTNSGGVVFSGTLTASGGALAGNLTLSSNSVLNLVGTSARYSIDGLIVLTNYGTVIWSNTDLIGPTNAQIFNFGLWNAQTDNTFFGNRTVFNNIGTFLKSAGGGTTTLDFYIPFNDSGTVDVESGALAISATLNGNPSFTGPGIIEGVLFSGDNASIGGKGTFSAATLTGPMTISNAAIVNLVGTFGSNTFSGHLTNYGTVNWISGDLSGISAENIVAKIDNYGLWDAKTNNTFYGGNSVNPTNKTTFNNYGTFRKSGGSGFTVLDTNVTFNTTGTVDVQAGILLIYAGTGSGIFNTANGGQMDLGGLTAYTLAGTSTFTGTGLVFGSLNGSNAVIQGSWTGPGGILSGTLTVASNATMTLANVPGFIAPQLELNGVILTNYGTVVWSNQDLYSSSVAAMQIYNYGLWDDQTNNTLYGAYSGGGTTTFNNYGTFRKSGGSLNDNPPVTIFDTHTFFNNYGTLDVQIGFVDIVGGGTGNGVFNNATNNTATELGASIAYVLTGNPTFTGGGGISGNIIGSNAVVHGTLTTSYSTLSGTLTIASNAVVTLSWIPTQPVLLQGTILTNFGTVVLNNGNLNCQSSPQIYNYGLWDDQTNNTIYGAYNSSGTTIFNNYGTFRKSGGTVNDGSPYYTTFDIYTTFNNYGTLDAQLGILEILGVSTGSGVFNSATNAITYLSKCTLTGNPTFTGPGFVQGTLTGSNAVLHGTINSFGDLGLAGTLTLAGNATANFVMPFESPTTFSGTLFTNYGTVLWTSGDLNAANSPQIYNYGLWDTKTDNTFHGAYVFSGTTTFNNYGTFRKSGGTGGQTSLDSATAFNNSGTLDVQTGLMNLGGNYTLTGGTLNFGINSSNNFGSINLANIAALAGKLSVNLNNNYSPAAGSSFGVVGYGSETGIFTATILPHLSGLIWQTNYGATMFTLSVTNVPAPQLSSAATQNGGAISVSWDALAGQTYQFQCTTNLAPANWVNLGGAISGTNGTMTASDVIGFDLQRFYRLVVLP